MQWQHPLAIRGQWVQHWAPLSLRSPKISVSWGFMRILSQCKWQTPQQQRSRRRKRARRAQPARKTRIRPTGDAPPSNRSAWGSSISKRLHHKSRKLMPNTNQGYSCSRKWSTTCAKKSIRKMSSSKVSKLKTIISNSKLAASTTMSLYRIILMARALRC